MKRLFLIIALVMLAFWVMARHCAEHSRPAGYFGHGTGPHFARHSHKTVPRPISAVALHESRQALHEARRTLDEAHNEVRHAFDEARDDVRQAFDEARDEVQRAFEEVRGELVSTDNPRHAFPPADLQPPSKACESAEGLPVPIVPGTRVSEARAQPPAPLRPRARVYHRAPAPPSAVPSVAATSSASVLVTEPVWATEERAKADARRRLQEKIVKELEPQVPATWTPPARLLDGMILQTRITPVDKDYGTLYQAELTIDDSPQRRAQLVEVYNRELIQHRLLSLGGTLAFILICLGAVSGYIRTDEATKGYYTNRLRMLAAAAVGAAGVVIYQLVA
jgi:hypothetical protein